MAGGMAALKVLATRLWSPALLAYAISAAVAVASFLSTLLLARLSGAAVIGQYALAMSTATLLASFAVLGLDRILIREVAGDLRQGNGGRARSVLLMVSRGVALAAAATAVGYLLVLLFTPFVARVDGNRAAMLIVAASALVWPLQRIGYSGLRAAGAPVLGQLFEALPTFLFLAGMALIWIGGMTPHAGEAVGLAVAAQGLACLGAWALLLPRAKRWGAAGSEVAESAERAALDRQLLLAGLPLMLTLFLQLFADWLLLARLSATMSPADAGAFRVAIQIVTIIATVVATTEAYVAARLAGDFRAGRPDLAWGRHRRATLVMLAMTAPLFLLLFAAPGRLLGFLFGPEFAVAGPALLVMLVAQLVNVLRGPLGSLLTMAGHERAQLGFTIGGLALVVLLAFALVPRFGLMGAAIAQAVPIIFRSVGGYVFARRRIPVDGPRR